MSGADPRVRAVLKLAPVIPVFTPDNVDDAVQVAQALFNGGLPVIEVTLRTANAMDAIKAMVEAVPDAVVGAGTVLTPAQMEKLKSVGGRFAVSPGATDTLYAAARDTDLPFLPGVATSSELMRGLEHGLYVQVLPGRAGWRRGHVVGLEWPVRRCAVLPDRRHQRADCLAVPASAERAVRGRFVVDHA